MKSALAAAVAILLTTPAPTAAHRLDEYLEAATLRVSRERLHVDLRLVPGVKVVPTVLDSIDSDRDGAISDAEERNYGGQVLGDLFLSVDDNRVPLRLVSRRFASVEEMRSGLGEIELGFDADLPAGGAHRRLVFENRHRSRIAAYLVNVLVPEDADIRITAQNRNYQQSVYELAYEQSPAGSVSVSFDALLRWGLVVGGLTVLLVDRLATVRRRRNAAAVVRAVDRAV